MSQSHDLKVFLLILFWVFPLSSHGTVYEDGFFSACSHSLASKEMEAFKLESQLRLDALKKKTRNFSHLRDPRGMWASLSRAKGPQPYFEGFLEEVSLKSSFTVAALEAQDGTYGPAFRELGYEFLTHVANNPSNHEFVMFEGPIEIAHAIGELDEGLGIKRDYGVYDYLWTAGKVAGAIYVYPLGIALLGKSLFDRATKKVVDYERFGGDVLNELNSPKQSPLMSNHILWQAVNYKGEWGVMVYIESANSSRSPISKNSHLLIFKGSIEPLTLWQSSHPN